MTTFAECRSAAKLAGATIELDEDSQCYRAAAPHGRCWEPELHELIAVFGNGIIGNGQTKAEARADLFERLKEYGKTEPCETQNCDWCMSH